MNHNQNRTEKTKKMKLPVYFRQSWQIMLKDRQYSLIYIIGVALSMAFVMAFLMYVLMSSSGIYPEKHRSRMLILSNVTLEDAEGKPRMSTMVSGRLAQLIEERCAQSDRSRRQCPQRSGDVCGSGVLGRVSV